MVSPVLRCASGGDGIRLKASTGRGVAAGVLTIRLVRRCSLNKSRGSWRCARSGVSGHDASRANRSAIHHGLHLSTATIHKHLCRLGISRLHLGSHTPIFTDATGRRVTLNVELGAQTTYHQLSYRGQMPVNVVGEWRKGHAEPLWVMSNLAPERALTIYFARMKIEEAFRDLKSLLNFDKLMNKSQQHMEQMAALVMLGPELDTNYQAVKSELFDL